jgi:mRNA interferase MazF
VVIRGAVYRINLGEAKRGHEQRGRRLGLVLSPSSMAWSVATVVPTSTSAQPAVFRPQVEIDGRRTLFLVDQIRVIDIQYISGEPVHFLDRADLAEVEHAVGRYLGLAL